LTDYSHRDILDKLGIKRGDAVAFAEVAGLLDAGLRERVLERVGRGPAGYDEAVNVVLASVDSTTDVTSLLRDWKTRITPGGGIWLLTPKRGLPGYIDQRDLIPAGLAAGLVDNKSCSVSDTTSAMRFVIRRADRP
jgi:Protein of unknown function (DUF3052)